MRHIFRMCQGNMFRSQEVMLADRIPRMPSDIRERIQMRLDALEISPRAASIASGMSADAIRSIFRNPENSPTLETIEKLAVGLKTTADWLAFGTGPIERSEAGAPQDLIPANRSFGLARVDGRVQAGVFLRAEAFDDVQDEVISAPRDPDFPHARQIAYRVAGDSMNKAERPIRDGDFVICAAWEDLGIESPDGLTVVVQRTLADGQSRERSVKEAKVFPDRVEFHPRSSNPAHEVIVVPRDLKAEDGTEVAILALVRFVFDNKPFPIPTGPGR